MTFQEAKTIFSELLELCHQTDNPRLIEIASALHQEVERANDLADIIRSAEELQVNLNELDFLPEEEEPVQDMHELIEKLSE